jgi:cob(I)alamin adenosyltransferase
MEEKFSEPRMAINRVYTRGGDSGQTSLAGGQRIAKDNIRLEAYGTVDELNSFVGLTRAGVEERMAEFPALAELAAILRRVQHELFNLGSILATRAADVHPRQARVTDREITQLELEIDRMNEVLSPLRSFVLPGGSRLNAELHVCRTICRRAERVVITLARQEEVPGEPVRYLNRLSDAFFVWSRWASHILGASEVLWEPNQSASSFPPAG